MRVLSVVLVMLALCGCKAPTAAVRAAEAKPLAPSPLISRTIEVKSSPAGASSLINGTYRGEGTPWECKLPTATKPAWAAFDVGVGPSRLLFSWFASANPDYMDTTYGGPGSYRLETSADSTDGENGAWTNVVVVPDNLVMNRAHFHEVIRKEPVLGTKLLWAFTQELSRRLRDTNEVLQQALAEQPEEEEVIVPFVDMGDD